MPAAHRAAIAIGSNLGDRAAHIAGAVAALAALPGTVILCRSEAIVTAPVGLPGGADPGGPYLNAAALLRTTLTPRELLSRLHAIERAAGRDRAAEIGRWGPRTLDLDLLLYDGQVIDEPGLRIPHPRMHERAFVLEPLAQIAPEFVVPTLGRTVAALLAALREREPRPARRPR
ncbi:MAG: 2-amino-4-hydroxy-6-hydroxymethyldihydropteridine diphosphokinase [Phycisphaeraceae bacterium]|nr:2-amino-4-hydroxy-6-hydroxymethyldihydropteridine diphosphokinase [Phycisphaeraceae bacterium]